MIDKVLASEACIGCGACAALQPDIKIVFNRYGDLVARLPQGISESQLLAASTVCPFASSQDEDSLAAERFSGSSHHPALGHYASLHAAYAPAFRPNGSSGGTVTWLLSHLLDNKLVDGVIHVAPSGDASAERFFDFRLSTCAEDVATGSTSFYYPVSLDKVLETIRSRPGRYAITGVPCFHKAIRLLRKQDSVIDERIAYQIGIACGQMKSAHYLEYLCGHAGVHAPIEAACFRRKVEGLPANDYAFEVRGRVQSGSSQVVDTRLVQNSKIGANWGMGYFKPKACEYCDDVLAETADICAMDAWLPKYVKDGAGWSLLVVREHGLLNVVQEGVARGELVVEETTPEDVYASQRSGFSHRRTALPYRLWMNRGRWLPSKRVSASTGLHPLLKIEQRVREMLRYNSRRLWLETGHQGDFAGFQRRMKKYLLMNRIIGKIKHVFL